MGDAGLAMAKNDYQRLLPTFVMTKMPLVMQILFFGALLSAIKSTSSATLLAPSTSFVENILKHLRPGMSDRQQLFAMRCTIVVFAALVLAYAIAMKGTSIYELVSTAYQVTLVAAFVPLVMGMYWKRATTQGAIVSVAAGMGTWILFFPQVSSFGERLPGPAGRPDRRVRRHVRRIARCRRCCRTAAKTVNANRPRWRRSASVASRRRGCGRPSRRSAPWSSPAAARRSCGRPRRA